MYTPPGVPRSRSFTRFTMRVGLEHFGQSVLLLVSMTFLGSPVLSIFAIMLALPNTNVDTNPDTNISAHDMNVLIRCQPYRQTKSNHPILLVKIVRDAPRGNRRRRTAIESPLQVYTTVAPKRAASPTHIHSPARSSSGAQVSSMLALTQAY